ncbi:hypothetical protein [Desulfonatronospira thiodismutans]|uniref:hypothetical protein n=1 Tax=Desulfonatronospira thiodismutans TaxID=488939 RepID=UPI0001975BEF|nr:hypothetical protein [Desulfonatronospira thiodismutans]
MYYPAINRLDGGGEVPESEWSGVVRIADGESSGSGVLSRSGLHILTAAHVVDDFDPSDTKVYFPG